MNAVKKRSFAAIFAAILLLNIVDYSILAAPDAAPRPAEMSADVIEYNTKTNIVTARGGIRLTQDSAVLTGDAGDYNTKTNEAHVMGKVKIIKEDSTLTADQVRSFDMKRFLAEGNAYLVKKDSTAKGPRMEYFSDRQYAIIQGGATLTNKDGILTADKTEAFFKDDFATADGNVRIISDVRKLDAVSDHAIYYGINGKNGKAELKGNVRAVQDGNVLTGNHVTIYMDDSAMDADGRSKLVITPKEKPKAPANVH